LRLPNGSAAPRLVIRRPAVDTRDRVSALPRNLRALALALMLPGLLLSGAVHLCVCLGELLDLGTGCPDAVSECCTLPEPGSRADQDACGDCCIAIDVEGGVAIAPLPQHDSDASGATIAPANVAHALVLELQFARPARAAPPLERPPGRAPIPLRI
jgi:hypothetical protein